MPNCHRALIPLALTLLVHAPFSHSQTGEADAQAAASALLESVQSARGLSNAAIKDGGGAPPAGGGGDGGNDGGGDDGGDSNEAQAQAFFEETVHDFIYPTCYNACHQSGGVAPSQGANLVFVGPGPTQIADNYDILVSFITNGGGSQLLLGNIAGNGHVGGSPYPQGTEGYQAIETFTEFF